MVFSVGGGNTRRNVSVNLIKAIKYAKSKNGKVICIVVSLMDMLIKIQKQIF